VSCQASGQGILAVWLSIPHTMEEIRAWLTEAYLDAAG